MDINCLTTQPDFGYPFTSTGVATVEFHSGDEHTISLKPLLVTVCFQGALPRQLVHQDIPINISVSLAEEHRAFTTPVVDVITWDVSHSAGRESFSPDEMSTIDLEDQANFGHYDPEPDVTVPFLPLPAKFNFATPLDWHSLSIQIEKWLVSGVSMESQYWAWGRDMFWLTFVATYPAFPRGKWRMWNSRIMPVGDFIEAWLAGNHDMQLTCTHFNSEWRVQTRGYILDEFCRHASLFHLTAFHIPDDT